MTCMPKNVRGRLEIGADSVKTETFKRQLQNIHIDMTHSNAMILVRSFDHQEHHSFFSLALNHDSFPKSGSYIR